MTRSAAHTDDAMEAAAVLSSIDAAIDPADEGAPVTLPATAQTPVRCPAGQEYQVDFGIQGLTSRNMEFHVRTVDGVRQRDVSFGAEAEVAQLG